MLLTRSPLAARLPRAAARLACVKHSASVQSEPGSNSSVQSCLNSLKRNIRGQNFTFDLSYFSCKCLLLYNLKPLQTSCSYLSATTQDLAKSFNSARRDTFDFSATTYNRPAPQTPTPIGCHFVKDSLATLSRQTPQPHRAASPHQAER